MRDERGQRHGPLGRRIRVFLGIEVASRWEVDDVGPAVKGAPGHPSPPRGNVPTPRRRPWPLTVLCLLGWSLVAVAVVRLAVRWRAFADVGTGVAVGGGVALAVTVIALVGYWRLKRWGLWLVLLGTGLRLAGGAWGAPPLRTTDLLWPAILLLVGFAYYRRLG